MEDYVIEAKPIEQRREEGDVVETRRTYCKLCMVACGLVAEVANGERILSVKADRDHPLTKGYSCPKGRATGQVYHLDRPITRPMMRKDGKLVEVEWDEALTDIGVRLRRIIDTHGPHSIGMYFGSGLGLDSAGYTMQEALYSALGTPPKFSPLTNDTTAKVMMAGAMAQFHGINPKVDYDYDGPQMVVYLGTNPMVSHAHNTGMFNPGNMLKAINRRGGEIWTIDPVRTETSNYARGHIACYPGRDYAMLAWVVREIIADGPLDPRQPVRGLDALRDLLKDCDRATAAEIAGVTEQAMQDFLDAIRRRKIVAIEIGTGVGMSPGGNLTVWLAWVIMVLTGSMNVKGGLWMHPGFLFPFDQLVEHLPILDDPFTPGSNVRPDVKGLLGDWPCAVLPTEIEAGNIRGFFNHGGSLLRAFPDANALKKALGRLDLHVGLEIQHNELSRYCTHLLPTKSTVERYEFTRWDTLNWAVSLMFSEPLVKKPMGERRSAWWVISEYMKRAGLPVPDDLPETDSHENDQIMLKRLMTMSRCSFEELKEKLYVERPRELPASWVQRHFERIGGWQLMPPYIVEQWRQFRAEDEANLGKPKPLVYSSRRQRRKMNAQLGFLGEAVDVILHPETAAERGIEDGQRVRISNKSGEIFMTAKLDPTMRPMVASVAHGHFTANVNLLTCAEDMDPLGGMAHYSAVPVEVEPAPSSEPVRMPETVDA